MSDTVLTTEAAVHHAHEEYLTAINSNDLALFLGTVTDDIVMLPPNSEPIAGKEAVGAWVAGYFEAIQTVWTKTTLELVVADGFAYEWYRYHVVYGDCLHESDDSDHHIFELDRPCVVN